MNQAPSLASSARTLGRRSAERAGGRPDPRAAAPPDLIVALLAWQVIWLAALLGGVVELTIYAAVHVASLLLLTAGLVLRRAFVPADGMPTAALQVIAWSAFGGPFGTFVAAAIVLRPAPRVEATTADAGADLSVCAEADHAEHVHLALRDCRMRVEGAQRVRPLMDVLADGLLSEKLAALGILYRRYDADLGPVLKHALRDPNASVRVLAATVTAKLNAIFSRRIGDRQAAAAAMPKSAQSWRNLAEARLAYAASGLLEASLARTELEAALGDLARAAEISPADREIGSRLQRTRRRLDAFRG
jgi:hypothetical protein